MILNKTKLNPLDIVIMNPEYFENVFDRVKKHGNLLANELDLGANIGFIIDLYEINFVLYYNKGFKLVPFSTIEDKVNRIKRNWVFGGSIDSYEFQSKLLRNLASEQAGENTMATIAREMNTGNFYATLFYLLTADKVSYPSEFVSGNIELVDLFSDDLGYFDVYREDSDV